MSVLEATARDYIDYGGLLAFLCLLKHAPHLPEKHDPIAINASLTVYETLLAAIADYRVDEASEAARAQLETLIDQMRSFLVAELGGHRGSTEAILSDLDTRTASIHYTLDQLSARLGYGSAEGLQ